LNLVVLFHTVAGFAVISAISQRHLSPEAIVVP
jgi:hypothetical protein